MGTNTETTKSYMAIRKGYSFLMNKKGYPSTGPWLSQTETPATARVPYLLSEAQEIKNQDWNDITETSSQKMVSRNANRWDHNNTETNVENNTINHATKTFMTSFSQTE